MWLLLKLYILLLCYLFITVWGFGEMIGQGRWLVQNIQECDDGDQYELKIILSRKKLNRTHDCFSMSMKHERPLDELYGIELDVYKKVDGGFKYYQFLKDDSVCHFVQKYAAVNFEKVLVLAGIDPPECPIAPGDYKVEEYVLDYNEFKDPFVYGLYEVNCYLVYGGQRVSCLKIYTQFEENNKNDDDGDD